MGQIYSGNRPWSVRLISQQKLEGVEMKKRIIAPALSGMMFLTGIAFAFSSSEKVNRSSLSINDILQAYNLPQTPDALTTYVAQAKRLTYYQVEPGSDMPGHYESIVTMAVNKDVCRRDRVYRQGEKQIDIYDSRNTYRAEFQNGKLAGAVSQLNDSESQSAQSAIKMFGILQVLKQLEANGDKTVSTSVTEDGQERFAIKTETEEWILYVNSERLISRLQMVRNSHHVTIDYADYRWIDDVRLPHIEKVYADGSLLYELFFTQIDLRPSFSADYFSRDILTREGVR